MYEIKIADKKDIKPIITFIKNHWNKTHIFSKDKKLLDWQHFNKNNNKYNFIIAKQKKTKKVIALLGFIPTNQFDKKIPINNFIWLVIWKVSDEFKGKKIGTSLLNYLLKKIRPQSLSTIGASEMTLGIYKSKGFSVGQLKHYYILNPFKSKFKLIKIKKKKFFIKKKSNSFFQALTLKDLINIKNDFFNINNYIPSKTKDYLVNRYFYHPRYKYKIYGIMNKSNISGIIIIRISKYKKINVLRIVDFFGPSRNLKNLYFEWLKLIKQNSAEYLDFYNEGINHRDLIESGFVLKKKRDFQSIVPNYFEPFIKKNITINYMINSKKNKNFRIVRGDSDQDRPNL